MKNLGFGIFLMMLVFVGPVHALTKVVQDCAVAAMSQKDSNFLSKSENKYLSDLVKEEKAIAMAQVKVAAKYIKMAKFDPDASYKYQLVFMGKNYDAINLDFGGNGWTVVFLKDSTQQVNIEFVDGDLYVNSKRCRNIQILGDVAF